VYVTQVTSGTDSAKAALIDQNKLSSLLTQQSLLIASLKNNEEKNLRVKLNELAQIVKQRMMLADPELRPLLSINQISTYITRTLRDQGIAIASNVNHYLADEFKDPNQQRKGLEDGSTSYCDDDIERLVSISKKMNSLIDEINGIEDHSTLEALSELFIEGDKAVDSRATAIGIILSRYERKKKHETPHGDPEISTCWEAIRWGREVVLKDTQDFFFKFPPPTPEKDRKWASGIVELFKLFPSMRNEKFSLLKTMWMTRIKYMTHQSKHGAAVKDEIMTILCENCYDLKTGRERPDTNPEMVRDRTSPTGFRCGSCNGVKGIKRGLTREQVGDNKEPYITQCEEFLNNIPYFCDMIEETYRESYMPYGYARKIDLGVELSEKS